MNFDDLTKRKILNKDLSIEKTKGLQKSFAQGWI